MALRMSKRDRLALEEETRRQQEAQEWKQFASTYHHRVLKLCAFFHADRERVTWHPAHVEIHDEFLPFDMLPEQYDWRYIRAVEHLEQLQQERIEEAEREKQLLKVRQQALEKLSPEERDAIRTLGL